MKTFQIGGIATLLKIVPNALLVPVSIENSWKIVQYGAFPLGTFCNIKWTVLPPIETQNENAEEIVLAAENSIRAQIGQTL